ncbi:GNAT family N-acetyltransferase [Epilithonimonas xixisoli]|uniref:Ribosomal protein S18 acetylase RimI-like enzyme n=1 Tax=Epilithonimonas xixisoli TaxID=1476462 RepID=A0A4R8IBP8_9FLAO|nr:GNAT family N-acetyltransferase [Epilithonimonas xixisoli]TDX87030.1 ribosomal protein S18 acetylase RimI-like enzyme [Epilithonimonas xixisoli]
MKHEILKANLSDIPELSQMMRDFYAIDLYPFDEKVTMDNFNKFITEEKYGNCFKILSEGQMAGYIILVKYFSFEFGGEILFLDELFIKSDFQGKSLGKKALEFVKNYSVENGFKVVLLEIENHNEKAKKLYENYGFQNHKRSLMILKN